MKDAFSGCSSISSIIFYSDGLINISQGCFSGLTPLRAITIPNCVRDSGSACFMNCGLTLVQFENNIISFDTLSPNLFKGCSGIETFKIPKNCKVIDSQCLSGTMISNVDLPDSVEVLGIQCFKDCTNLVSINIKATSHLRQIDYGVFEGCLSFSQINEFTSQNFVCESGALYSSVLFQNVNNKTFISLFKKSGLIISTDSFCSGFSCKVNSYSNMNLPLTYITAFILI